MLDAPEEMYTPESLTARRRHRRAILDPRPGAVSRLDSGRDFEDDFADGMSDLTDAAEASQRRQNGAVRFHFNGRPVRMPKTLWGRLFGGASVLLFFAVLFAVGFAVRSFFLHDPRFIVESSSYVESVGNTHVTRAQLLSVFGEDVERNIFNIPLAERRAELEQLPWVEHATVMRLLPNHVRVLITERTPVALVRQGTQLGMVDASGVLLDIPADTPGDPRYSFPVLTAGIAAADPLSTRAARMKILVQFMDELDSTGEHISKKVSEVDLANPEDVKALIFEGSSDVLVHFGDSDFLPRYRKFEQHLAEWRMQYPKLSSVDMRYDRQVVLDMQPGSEAATQPEPLAGVKHATEPASRAVASPVAQVSAQVGARSGVQAAKPVVRAAAKPAGKSPLKSPAKPAPKSAAGDWHMVFVKPHSKASAALAARPRITAGTAHSSQAGPQ